jgi:formylmethanofuran dehydrogenase subunit D
VAGTLRSYPNPTSGIVTIESASIQTGDKIELYDTHGQLVHQFSARKNQTTINLSFLPKGTYILKVNNKQAKIIKN